MSNASILIQNELTTPLSLDFEIAPKRNVRANLAAGASVDVGDICSLSELNANPQFQALLAAGQVSVSVTRGTSDVEGSDSTAVIDASGMAGANPRLVATIAAGAAGARDVTIYDANFPFDALLVDVQVMVNTAVAGTVTLRDATGGAGNALSAANSTAAAVRVRDPGTGATAGAGVVPTIAKDSSLIARMTAGDAACRIIMEFARTA